MKRVWSGAALQAVLEAVFNTKDVLLEWSNPKEKQIKYRVADQLRVIFYHREGKGYRAYILSASEGGVAERDISGNLGDNKQTLQAVLGCVAEIRQNLEAKEREIIGVKSLLPSA